MSRGGRAFSRCLRNPGRWCEEDFAAAGEGGGETVDVGECHFANPRDGSELAFSGGGERVIFQGSPRRSARDAKTALAARPKRVLPHGGGGMGKTRKQKLESRK